MASQIGETNKDKLVLSTFQQHDLKSIFWSKKCYNHFAQHFHPWHKHDLNSLFHLFTTGAGFYGAVRLVISLDGISFVYFYAGVIAATTPVVTAFFHTIFIYGCVLLPLADTIPTETIENISGGSLTVCFCIIISGILFQDLAHWLCVEPTMLSSYIKDEPSILIVHTFWLMPLVIDSVLLRHFFAPKLFVSRNRILYCKVESKKAIDRVRTWINQEVPEKSETTHIWPHKQERIDGAVGQLENDAAILSGFRKIFAAHHFDIRPVVDMNEIYVTAVGAIKEITSDAVFYTPHVDGPFWFLPGASLYRVLIGVTPNKMVRTKFNLQHSSKDRIVNIYDALGFDYNRELHWIDRVPGQKNNERRSLIKLHYVVYPKGWHTYGNLCAYMNKSYNTWARGNFLVTLRPVTLYEQAVAWWIFSTTWSNAMWEIHVGWPNLVYVIVAYLMGERPFLFLTSFRHYFIYISTFAYRTPAVAHGYLMRDCKLYKTLALMHLSKRILPLIQFPRDVLGVTLILSGVAITILATVQLGIVRTYFGSELGFVKPKWVEGFPYNTIPHPMIAGQLFAYSVILFWWKEDLSVETKILVASHMTFYIFHMLQEIIQQK